MLTVTTHRPDKEGSYKLQLDNATTTCIPLGADAATVELRLEEMVNVDGVSVTKSTSESGYAYTITFDGSCAGRRAADCGHLSDGDQSKLTMVPKHSADCDSFSHLAAELAITTVVDGAYAAVPEVVELKTSAWSALSGSFDLSVGFDGDYTSLLARHRSDTHVGFGEVTGTVTAGSKRVRMSADVTDFISRGDVVKIGGELHRVDEIGVFDKFWLPLDSYHQAGCSNCYLYVSDTALSVATTITDSSYHMSTKYPLSRLIAPGEQVMMYDGLNEYEHVYTLDNVYNSGS